MDKGKLIIVSGFSGVGKGTVIKELMNRHPDEYAFSVSATTREPRIGEKDGVDYFFISKERFEEMISAGELLEYARYGDNYYGTPLAPVERMLDEGKNIIFDIEVNGMHNVTAKMPDAITIFVVPPSSRDLIDRLSGRGTEDEAQLIARLTRATEEARFAGEYQCIIQNIDVSRSTDDLEEFIKTGKQLANVRVRNLGVASDVCEGIKSYIKQENS